MMRHLANAQYWTGLAGVKTGRLFLLFGGLFCANQISNCPFDRVLTYKNLIYLILNLQICVEQRGASRKLGELCHSTVKRRL